MHTSLSFVFPVYNAEATLKRRVRHVLDLLADLSVGFELLLIDDGSVDDTLGEARDLGRHFAQVRVIHCPLHYGHSAAVQLGLRESNSPFVMIYNHRQFPIGLEIRDLWENRLQLASHATDGDETSRTCWAAHDSLMADHGTVIEAGPVIMVHRWEMADAAALEDFVRAPEDRVWHPHPHDVAHVETLSRPYCLTPQAGQLESIW